MDKDIQKKVDNWKLENRDLHKRMEKDSDLQKFIENNFLEKNDIQKFIKNSCNHYMPRAVMYFEIFKKIQ